MWHSIHVWKKNLWHEYIYNSGLKNSCFTKMHDYVFFVSSKMVQQYNFTSKTWTTWTPFLLDNINFGCVLIPGSKDKILSVADARPIETSFVAQPPTIYDATMHVFSYTNHQAITRIGTTLVFKSTNFKFVLNHGHPQQGLQPGHLHPLNYRIWSSG